MTAKKAVAIIAVLGIFAFLAVAPVGATEPVDTSKTKTDITQTAETAKTSAKEVTMEKGYCSHAIAHGFREMHCCAECAGFNKENENEFVSKLKVAIALALKWWLASKKLQDDN